MTRQILLIGSILLAAASPATASKYTYGSVAALVATAGSGACGGSIGCVAEQNQAFSPATAALTAHAANANTAYGGLNTASASATTGFGSQHAYAQTYASAVFYGVVPTYAESSASSESYDVFDGANSSGGPVSGIFSITGSLSPTDGVYGANSGLYFQFFVYDLTNQKVLLNYVKSIDGSFISPDVFTLTYSPPAGSTYSIDSYLEADAYVSSYDRIAGAPLVIADFSHTLKYRLAAAPGSPDIIGESGHDYRLLPASGTVAEPATWAMLIAGFGLTGVLGRRRVEHTVAR